MKKALLAALFVMVTASWCLAQTDSLPAPTAEPCQSAPCAEPCQPGCCAAPCQPAPCPEPFVPKWAVGLRTSSLINLPGTIILQRYFNDKIAISAGFSVSYNNPNYASKYVYPTDQYTYEDEYQRYNNENKYINFTFSPEISLKITNVGWVKVFSGLNTSYSYTKGTRSSDNWSIHNYVTPPETVTSHTEGWMRGHTATFIVPINLERDVKIKKYRFSVGVTSTIISVSKYFERGEETTEYSDQDTTKITYERNTPIGIEIKNPLQGNIGLQIKYYF